MAEDVSEIKGPDQITGGYIRWSLLAWPGYRRTKDEPVHFS